MAELKIFKIFGEYVQRHRDSGIGNRHRGDKF